MLPSASKAAILVSLDNKAYSSRCDFSAARLFGRRRSSGPGGRGRARLFRSGGFDRRRRRRGRLGGGRRSCARDRKSTRLNSSHPSTSYAVFCLKKKRTDLLSLLGFDEGLVACS